MAQFQAGYILDAVKSIFQEKQEKKKLFDLLDSLSIFEAEVYSENTRNKQENSDIAAVCSNIISRDTPTTASTYINSVFRDAFSNQSEWSGLYLTENPDNTSLKDLVLKSLHIIDPRITVKSQTEHFNKNWEKFGKEYKDEFFYRIIPEYLGAPFLQLLERDIDIHSILEFSESGNPELKHYKKGKASERIASELDFAHEFPYPVNNTNGLAIEVRNARKEKLEQRHTDSHRDKAIKTADWQAPYRYRNTDFKNIRRKLQPLVKFTESEYFSRISDNYVNPLYKTQNGLNALEINLSPFAIARIQKILLQFIYTGQLSLNQERWKIGIIERDVSAGIYALEDLKKLLNNLLNLKNAGAKLPEIAPVIFYTEAFKNSTLKAKQKENASFNFQMFPLEKFSENTRYDILLDISILQRRSVINPEIRHSAKNFAKIRSAHKTKSYRYFLFDNHINYNNATNTDSLQYLINTIYREKNVLFGQKELLISNLNNNHSLGVLPSQGGKPFVYHLSALLQPCISLVTVPSTHFALDQEILLKSQGINISGRYSIVNQSPDTRQEVTQNIHRGRILLLYAFAGNFQHKEFRRVLKNMPQEKSSFGYAFIDEAHCMSDWSHDFRFPYYGIVETLKKNLRISEEEPVPITALTSTASKPVISEIQDTLAISDANLVYEHSPVGQNNYKIIKIKNPNVFYNTFLTKAYTKISSKKQVQLTQIITDIYEDEDYNQKTKGKTLIICPYQESILGINTSDHQGISDKLKNTFKQLKITEFFGSYENIYEQVSRYSDDRTMDNLITIHEDNPDIIVTKEDLGIGINVSDIRHIIYMNMPNSPERFIHINDRVSGKNQQANIYVLYNNQPLQYSENDSTNSQVNSGISVDKHINIQEHKKFFSSQKQEQTILKELLTRITFPKERPEALIEEAIESEYGLNVELNYHPADNPYQLYINHANKSFGYIDYRSYTNVTENATLNPELGNKILNFTKKEIERLSDKGKNVFKWLKQPRQHPPIPGIETIFEKISRREQANLTLHFRNDKITQITEMLQKNVSSSFTETGVRKAYLRVNSEKDFIDEINKIADISKIRNEKAKDVTKDLTTKFYQIRERRDTLSAVKRLKTVGVIDDFTIDYHAKNITLTISPKKEENYLLILKRYLQRYVTPNYANKVYTELEQYLGEDILQKALNFLVSFVYSEIKPYHTRQLEQIDTLISYPVHDKTSDKETSHIISTYLKHHLHTKYANPYLSFNLVSDTNNLTEEKYKILLKYIKETGHLKSKHAHLLHSTEQLLERNPNNYVLLILNAYAAIILYPDNTEIFYKAYDRLAKGAIRMYESDNISYQDFITKLNIILKKIYEQNKNIQETIESILRLKIHHEWIKNFNKKFLNNYREKFGKIYNI